MAVGSFSFSKKKTVPRTMCPKNRSSVCIEERCVSIRRADDFVRIAGDASAKKTSPVSCTNVCIRIYIYVGEKIRIAWTRLTHSLSLSLSLSVVRMHSPLPLSFRYANRKQYRSTRSPSSFVTLVRYRPPHTYTKKRTNLLTYLSSSCFLLQTTHSHDSTYVTLDRSTRLQSIAR